MTNPLDDLLQAKIEESKTSEVADDQYRSQRMAERLEAKVLDMKTLAMTFTDKLPVATKDALEASGLAWEYEKFHSAVGSIKSKGVQFYISVEPSQPDATGPRVTLLIELKDVNGRPFARPLHRYKIGINNVDPQELSTWLLGAMADGVRKVNEGHF